MTTTSSSQRKARQDRGVVVVARDRAIFHSLYLCPQMTRVQLELRHFRNLSHQPGHWHSAAATTRLTKLSREGFVYRRRLPHSQTAGAACYSYTIGRAAVPYLHADLDIDLDLVKRRQEGDARLSFMTYPHRGLTADSYIAFANGCDDAGYAVRWYPEHELSPDVVEHAGKKLPVRPDAALYLTHLPAGASFSFLEIQVASDPGKLLRKALAYAVWYQSGLYQKLYKRSSFRVLTVTTTKARAQNICNTLSESHELRKVGGMERFWVTWREALVGDVWGQVWFRADGGTDRRYRLLGMRTTS